MKYLLITLMTIIPQASCDDFTKLSPVSNRNEANFYKTSDDMLNAVNACYAGLQATGVYGRSYWVLFEMRSDNTDQGPDATGIARAFTNINIFTEDALNEIVGNAWSDSYRVVANCNVVLGRIEAVAMNTDLKERIKGEALFLRALMYYHLTVAFGNIPLVLEEQKAYKSLTQVNATIIYPQLIADLKQAEKKLKIKYTADQTGRATKGAAATLLAKIHLTMGDTDKAKVVLKRIVSRYGYRLVVDYADLWGSVNENNEESIFELQFISGGKGQGSAFVNDFSPDSYLQTGQGFGRNRPTLSMKNAYEEGDTRFSVSMGTTYRNAQNQQVNAFYIKKYMDNPPVENDSDANFIVFRYADVLLMLAEALGESPEAYGYINQVRARAGLAAINKDSPGTFKEKLLHERRVELAFENHRWADLKRFEVVAESLIKAIDDLKETNIRLLFRIPQRELDLNTNFKQNAD